MQLSIYEHGTTVPFCEFTLAMVGSSGLEPPTSRLSGVCSNLLSYEPVGGGNRVRTDDPLLAGQVLYQLSYTPEYINVLSDGNIKINAPLVGMHKFVLKMNKKETNSFCID